MGWTALLWIAIFFTGIWADADEMIKIGEVNPITGAIGRYGTTCHQGIQLAIDQANSAGGSLGQKDRFAYRRQSIASRPDLDHCPKVCHSGQGRRDHRRSDLFGDA